MKRYTNILTALLVMTTAWVFACTEEAIRVGESTGNPSQPPAVDGADAYLREQMRARWSSPERRTWRIEYRPITGLSDRSSWHVQGTSWWVRIYPDVFKLDDLDKKHIHELDAVALDQNYGVIDFYVYSRPQEVPKEGHKVSDSRGVPDRE